MSGMKVETKQRAVIGVRGIVQVSASVRCLPSGASVSVKRLGAQHLRKVEIAVEGGESAIRNFLQALKTQAPSMARIEQIEANFTAPEGYTDFRIRESLTEKDTYQLISPDIATCAACRDEIFDPADRRYRYPSRTVTNLRPPLTIIEDIPYDRPKTTMRNSKCVHAVNRNTTTSSTGVFTPSQMPVPSAARAGAGRRQTE